MPSQRTAPSWSDVKAKLSDCDRAGLMRLVQDRYAAGKDNRAFLHARLHLAGNCGQVNLTR